VLALYGYEFDVDYQRAVGAWVKCLICLDDVPNGKRRFECDVLLNQNLGVAAEDYKPYVLPKTTLLLGPGYALLNAKIRQHVGSYLASAKPRRVLVTLGGADPANHTARVLKELADISDLEIDVVLGSLYPHANPGDNLVGVTPGRVRVHRGLDSLLDLARQADLAVTAAGSTVWEFACLGVPMVVVGTADNQERVLRGLEKEKAAKVLGRIEDLDSGAIAKSVNRLMADPAGLRELSSSASSLVDGQGVERVVDVIAEQVIRAKAAAMSMKG
jgi:UDP-2,4-diacetamido-2,4,6-trideoxy-beta-L-altropyranose hydrolase